MNKLKTNSKKANLNQTEMKTKLTAPKQIFGIFTILLMGGFSLEIEASESYTKIKLIKQQSPITEVFNLISDATQQNMMHRGKSSTLTSHASYKTEVPLTQDSN